MKRNSILGLLSTLACVLVMVLASVSPALAADAAPTGTITVTSEANSTSSLYQIIEVQDWTTGSTNAPKFVWVNGVANWVRSQYPNYIGTGTDNAVQEAFSKLSADQSKAFYEALAAAIGDGQGQLNLTADATLTFGAGETSKTTEQIAMGGYLIKSASTATTGNVRIFSPSEVNLVPTKGDDGAYTLNPATKDVTVKSTKPTISKSQDTTDLTVGGMVGKTVTYTIIADVPTYAESYTNKTFSIDDVMSKGLAYTEGSAKFYTVTDNKPTSTELTTGALTAGTATKQDNGSTKITFAGDWDKLSAYAGQKIAVVYKATITSDAVVHTALTNDATLNYGNNFTVSSEQTKLYTYGISVFKYEMKNGQQSALKGAKFELQYTDKDGNAQKVSFTGTKGSYTAVSAGTAGAVTEIEVGDDGKLLLSNLAEGTYKLVETVAPSGYQKLQQPIEVTITKNGDAGDVQNPDQANAGFVYQTVENKQGFSLPTTGGTGTLLLTAAGVVLLGGSLMLVLRLRRQR